VKSRSGSPSCSFAWCRVGRLCAKYQLGVNHDEPREFTNSPLPPSVWNGLHGWGHDWANEASTSSLQILVVKGSPFGEFGRFYLAVQVIGIHEDRVSKTPERLVSKRWTTAVKLCVPSRWGLPTQGVDCIVTDQHSAAQASYILYLTRRAPSRHRFDFVAQRKECKIWSFFGKNNEIAPINFNELWLQWRFL